MIILLNIFFFVVLLSSVSSANIEVYSGGRHFHSFENYQEAIKSKIIEFDHQLNANPNIAKKVSNIDQNKINQISFNKGVEESLINFNHNWNNIRFIDMVDSNELESTLKETIGKNNRPALIISESGKLRILSFESK